MSAGVGIWKDVLLKAAHIPARKVTVAAPPVSSPAVAASRPMVSLVRQIFSPAVTTRRTRVLFTAADRETNLTAVCEEAGQVLAEVTGAVVAIVETSSQTLPEMKKAPRSIAPAEYWRSYSSQIAANLWRVPSAVWNHRFQGGGGRGTPENARFPFDYVLFAATVADSELSLFCSICDGVVLVLTANRTRKESALRAKEQLSQCNAQLLGTVLDGRTFPVPEAIYQRL